VTGDDEPDGEGTETEASSSAETTKTIEAPEERSASTAEGSNADAESDSAESESTEMAEDSEKAELDHAAQSFVEVEQEMKGLAEGMRGRGEAIGVKRVPTSEIPDDYPAEIDTEEALALQLSMVDADNETVVVYFEWPDQGTDPRLARLLSLRDIPMDRFADIHGETILLTIEHGYYVPVLPDEEPRGDSRSFYGIIAGLVPSLLIALAGIFGLGSFVFNAPFFLLWLVSTFLILPASVYLDAWNLRTTTDWDGGPLFWAFFSMIPALNVMAVPAYLIIRENAEPII
jgi:hypothetical protein